MMHFNQQTETAALRLISTLVWTEKKNGMHAGMCSERFREQDKWIQSNVRKLSRLKTDVLRLSRNITYDHIISKLLIEVHKKTYTLVPSLFSSDFSFFFLSFFFSIFIWKLKQKQRLHVKQFQHISYASALIFSTRKIYDGEMSENSKLFRLVKERIAYIENDPIKIV